MKMSRAAYRYAKAALKFASKESEALGDDMDQALALLEAHEDVASFLENPLLPAKAKKETLIKLIPQHTKAFAQLLEVLATNNRLSILEAVARQYKKRNELQQGQLSCRRHRSRRRARWLGHCRSLVAPKLRRHA